MCLCTRGTGACTNARTRAHPPHTHMHAYTPHTHASACTRAQTQTHTHAHPPPRSLVCMHACTNSHPHPHTHTHVHADACTRCTRTLAPVRKRSLRNRFWQVALRSIPSGVMPSVFSISVPYLDSASCSKHAISGSACNKHATPGSACGEHAIPESACSKHAIPGSACHTWTARRAASMHTMKHVFGVSTWHVNKTEGEHMARQ